MAVAITFKQDIKALEQNLRYEIDIKCAELKTDLIKWVLSIVFTVSAAQAAIIIGVLKYLH